MEFKLRDEVRFTDIESEEFRSDSIVDERVRRSFSHGCIVVGVDMDDNELPYKLKSKDGFIHCTHGSNLKLISRVKTVEEELLFKIEHLHLLLEQKQIQVFMLESELRMNELKHDYMKLEKIITERERGVE